MDLLLDRRRLIGAACAFPLLALPGCASLGGFVFEDAIRRLLTLSSQRAFARLLQADGFFEDEVARIGLPPQLEGAGAVASVLLRTPLVQRQLLQLMNRAAADAAEAAAPVVYDTIRGMGFADAAALVRGGPTGATDLLERSMGSRIVEIMFPQVGNALRLLDSGVLNQVLRVATGVDFGGLQRHVAESASRGIYRAIGREEAAIRADPRGAGDPVIASVFGGAV